MTIKVALIDDQALVRSGISSLLRLSDKVTVIAEGDDGERAIPIANEFDPDIFLRKEQKNILDKRTVDRQTIEQ